MAVTFVPCGDWTRQQWLDYRFRGVGASELGTIAGQNEYQCALELHHLKIGRAKPRPMNIRKNIGKIAEDVNAKVWQYWEKDMVKWNDNMTNGRIVRTHEPVNAYCHNDKYPHIFVSCDHKFKDPRYGDAWCNLELKNKTAQAYNKWENKMNPVELLQLAGQTIVTEWPYSEISYFIGNDSLDVLSIELKQAKSLEKSIVASVDAFWTNVEKARIIINQIEHAKYNYNQKLEAELEMELLQLEPGPESTQAYMDYMTELARQRKESIPMKGDKEFLAKARKLVKLSEQRKKIEQEELDLRSDLAHAMRQADKYEIDFGKAGSVSLFGGKFKNKVK